MPYEYKSGDEILRAIEDAYDASVAPKKLYRNNNNKLHLICKADAAGYKLMMDSIIAQKNRFDPQYCPSSDLKSTAKLLGTNYRTGKSSILQIVTANVSTTTSHNLIAGNYQYLSASGEIFTFNVPLDKTFAPLETKSYYGVSAHIGPFPVTDNTGIVIQRVDTSPINGDFSFSCLNNSGSLGYLDETDEQFRLRILTDTGRQDLIVELQEEIRNLPTIFECNCVFNPTTTPVVVDGITLAAEELLISITGVPTDEIAEIVARNTIYKTHVVNALDVVHYASSVYAGGAYPVYFKYHAQTVYTSAVEYNYDATKYRTDQIEAVFNSLLSKYKYANTHSDTITEYDVYQSLSAHGLSGVHILNVNLLVGGSPVSYVTVPKTRIPQMASVAYTSVSV